jgi:hypothetical protein
MLLPRENEKQERAPPEQREKKAQWKKKTKVVRKKVML